MSVTAKKVYNIGPSSPLVFAVQEGRQDLVHLIVKVLEFNVDVDANEEFSGMTPLAAAVESGNTGMIKYLVNSLGANVNQPFRLTERFKPDVEGSVALIALKNLDQNMIKFLRCKGWWTANDNGTRCSPNRPRKKRC